MSKTSVKQKLRQLCNAVLLAGIIIFFTGLYYWMIKAGIPYQDPPPELQIQYAVYMGIGDELMGKGAVITACGGAGRLLLKLLWKNVKTDRA